MEKQNSKNNLEILTSVKFVGITFDPDSYKKGQNELNQAIKMGYKVLADYPTSSGVVFSVGLYANNSEDVTSKAPLFPSIPLQSDSEDETK